MMRFDPLSRLRATASIARPASRLEVVAARLWNVLNEGKPFTLVWALACIAALSAYRIAGGAPWWGAPLGLAAVAPLALLFYRYDFPLRLRLALWGLLALWLALTRSLDPVVLALVLGSYLWFTVILWGTVYYHFRIGTPWTNFLRFWRLVLENPDPTSGNFLEQVPKLLLLVSAHQYFLAEPSGGRALLVLGFTAAAAAVAVLVHQWFFTWAPVPSLVPTRHVNSSGTRHARRFLLIVIDGCRADRLREARTPVLDRLREEGAEFTNLRTVYPARTVTCFASMLTGASPRVHGMRSNFVPRLGVRCQSIFDVLEEHGMRGKLVGIAHLIDAFGDRVASVSAVARNEEIDAALIRRAKEVLERERPELLVLQLLSVDQTGHARGSYREEYLERIEATDAAIGEFLAWCEERGFLEGATVFVTADHGQGIGIGGHGHCTPSEVVVPGIAWGAGVPRGLEDARERSIMDVAPTIAYLLGVPPPAASTGQVLFGPGLADDAQGRVAVIIPAHDEAASIGSVLDAIPRPLCGRQPFVIVVDDGSEDGTGEVARAHGADLVVRHERNRGLGAALRTGLETARRAGVEAAVYLDADGEYQAAEIPRLLEPVLAGEADYVVGSRYLAGRPAEQSRMRYLGNLIFTAALSVLAGRRLSDGQSGFRAFSARALAVAEIVHDYNYAQVLTLDLLSKGMRMREVPISYRVRRQGRSFVNWHYLWRVPLGIGKELLRGSA